MFRRAFIAALPCVVLAGCSGDDGSGDDSTESSPPADPSGPAEYLGDFMVSNDSGSERAVTLRVESGDDLLLEETITLLPGFQKRVSNPIDSQGTYDITASLESGESTTYTWTINWCRDTGFLEFQVTETTEVKVIERVETEDPQTECPSETSTEQN